MAIGDLVSEGLRVHERLSAKERDARVAAALAEVGLPAESVRRYPHEFSGGPNASASPLPVRWCCSRGCWCWTSRPPPWTGRCRRRSSALLRDLQQRHGLAYLFISHDLAVVRALAHRVMVLRAGRVVEEGEADAVFAAPREPYTRALMAAAFAV